jgi:predicted nucleic acid-binding protein
MTLRERLEGLTRVFLDSAPVIYFIENNVDFHARLEPLFARIDSRSIQAVVSPVTLAECLVLPLELGNTDLADVYAHALTSGETMELVTIDKTVAIQAAKVRAKYGLALTDAVQVATAIAARCEAVVTNDTAYAKVAEVPVVLVKDYSA